MSIKAIDADATIHEDRLLTLQLPPAVPTGRYRVIVILDQPSLSAGAPTATTSDGERPFPIIPEARWPDDMPLRREDLYDDSGRQPGVH